MKSPACKNECALDAVIMIDSDEEPKIEAQLEGETDSNNDATVIDYSSNRPIIDINPGNTAIQSGLERQRSTEINSAVPCQSSSSASHGKKKMIRSKFQCDVCLQTYRQTSRLIFHRRVHLDDGSVHCRICLCRLSTKTERAIHEKKCTKSDTNVICVANI